MWEYFAQNMCTDDVVANFTNSKGLSILWVYHVNGGYMAYPRNGYDFIKPISVYNCLVIDCEEEKNLSAQAVLLMRLKKACKLVQEQYNEQISRIRSLIE